MKLVVTGAVGYIGSEFIRRVPAETVDRVVLLDNFHLPRYASLFNLPNEVPFRFVEADVCEADLDRFFDGADLVIHLAALTSPEGSFENPDTVIATNMRSTKRVVDACIRCNCKLLFASTTSVYAEVGDVIVEEASARTEVKPQSPYAESKLRAEQMIQRRGAEGALSYALFRMASTFGPSIGMRFDTAVNKFVWQACLGKPLTVWQTALEQRRPYLDLHDAVRALTFALEADLYDGRTYNVVSQNGTVADIIDVIRRYVPSVTVDFVESPAMNEFSYGASNERLRREGMTFEGSLDRGISETVRLLEGIACSDLVLQQRESKSIRSIRR